LALPLSAKAFLDNLAPLRYTQNKLDKIDNLWSMNMPVKLKSSEVQQSFGETIDRALVGDDIIVERYGTPRVAIVEYGRYQRLVEAEKELLRARLQQASAAAAARAAHLSVAEADELIERARTEAHQETSGT
jgi:hypothetical protein